MISYINGFFILNHLKKIQYWKKEDIYNYQESKIKNIIKYAYDNTKFYHDLFKKNNIKPYDINKLKDINKIPIINKQDIRSNMTDLTSHVDLLKLRKLRTSGSSGSPLFIYINSKENLIRKAVHIRANTNLGQKMRDRWVTITAPHHFGEITWLQNALNIYCPRPVSVFTDVNKQVHQIEKLRPNILDGYATSLYLLAENVSRIKNHNIHPKFIISSAEMLRQSHRKFIEGVFGVQVYDQYSCVEFGRLSWECKERLGYHMDVDKILIQFLDENEDEVGVGESGKIVCTSLFNFSMPIIRYSIDDLGTLSDELCPCGVNFPLMKSIEGREDSLIKLPDGREISPRAFSIAMSMFKYYDVLHKFQIIQKKKNFFKIYLCLNIEEIDKNVLFSELESHMFNMLNINRDEVIFDIELLEDIPVHKSGKFKYIISEL